MLINSLVLFILGIIDLTFNLMIFEGDYGRGYHSMNHLRFAVVDLNKSKSYPANFVSILPLRIDSAGKIPSAFTKFFGNKSLQTAQRLLTASLKKEHCSEIKTEIERRLNLLEPNPLIYVKCRVCKKFFQTSKKRIFKLKICPECLKRQDRNE
jgi:hypothetical protein